MTTLKLSKWGNSSGIRISKDILDLLNISTNEIDKDNVRFNVEVRDDNLILTLDKKKNSLEMLFEDFDQDSAEYKADFDWGKPVGNEVW